jgi:hypothetical protein
MNQEMKNKRDELKAISQGFKPLVKEGAIGSVNEGLENYYREQGHADLKSYNRWKEAGFQVKKGMKALLLWGEPKPIKKAGVEVKEGEEESFFPLSYVFSNLQVEPL